MSPESRETGASSGGGRNPAEQHPNAIPLCAPWPPRSIQGNMLIAIFEPVHYPVNAGSGECGFQTETMLTLTTRSTSALDRRRTVEPRQGPGDAHQAASY